MINKHAAEWEEDLQKAKKFLSCCCLCPNELKERACALSRGMPEMLEGKKTQIYCSELSWYHDYSVLSLSSSLLLQCLLQDQMPPKSIASGGRSVCWLFSPTGTREQKWLDIWFTHTNSHALTDWQFPLGNSSWLTVCRHSEFALFILLKSVTYLKLSVEGDRPCHSIWCFISYLLMGRY